jgi:hypothetical protein
MAACSSVVKPSGAAQDEMMVNASLKMRGAGPAERPTFNRAESSFDAKRRLRPVGSA